MRFELRGVRRLRALEHWVAAESRRILAGAVANPVQDALKLTRAGTTAKLRAIARSRVSARLLARRRPQERPGRYENARGAEGHGDASPSPEPTAKPGDDGANHAYVDRHRLRSWGARVTGAAHPTTPARPVSQVDRRRDVVGKCQRHSIPRKHCYHTVTIVMKQFKLNKLSTLFVCFRLTQAP